MTADRNMEGKASTQGVPLEGAALPPSGWTFDEVQDRLVEAMITCWRNPDRERAWLRVRCTWPDIQRDAMEGDSDARGGHGLGIEPVIRPAALTRRDVAEMDEAFGWMDMVAPADRKVVGLALGQLARGRREVSWRHMLRPMGLRHGADGLRMRYGRALATIAGALNGGNPRASVSTPEK